ncbi:hypothetical protein NDU88_007881 [Pleurodeles waltl]|uniref:Uncharacterized protein n=1 Tax=Pleurodeles waltl TaxID=8319 RepID=A0AAV7RRK2_PLEWA|nr:hypothetical protein NDU88_007881 [Pleurodeles waltl]
MAAIVRIWDRVSFNPALVFTLRTSACEEYQVLFLTGANLSWTPGVPENKGVEWKELPVLNRSECEKTDSFHHKKKMGA